ncbi:MAG: endonuclease/exonuclease/phosphatase family protein [Bacteroidaceae bacterium]|nr:endonuclease/exonuclease/phosphatase family protein [Bacteroidaceae bacterium]
MYKILCFFALLCAMLVSCGGDTMRVMSYNVHHCRGVDGKIDYARIAEVINRVSPDFVALQELDSATTRNNGKVCIDELASATGMFASYASAIKFGGGSYGLGLLSREEPLATRVVPLVSSGEARRLLVVEFEKYVACCTHFPLKGDDRVASAEVLCEALQGCEKPLFLVGDMNCCVGDPEQQLLARSFKVLNNPADATYPSINPEECIDFIYTLDNGYSCETLKSEVLFGDSIASDHLPLYVDVKFERR